MNRVRRILVWLSRINRCKGFGIQSPWAYAFVCKVINNHRPYAGYAEVESHKRDQSHMEKKLGRLCLRLADSLGAKTMVNSGGNDDTSSLYLRAGSGDAELINLPDGCTVDTFRSLTGHVRSIDLMRFTPENCNQELFEETARKAHDGSVFIIEGIKRGARMKRFWREVALPADGAVTFDLHYCGLVCFKPKLYKQDYVVNF